MTHIHWLGLWNEKKETLLARDRNLLELDSLCDAGQTVDKIQLNAQNVLSLSLSLSLSISLSLCARDRKKERGGKGGRERETERNRREQRFVHLSLGCLKTMRQRVSLAKKAVSAVNSPAQTYPNQLILMIACQ